MQTALRMTTQVHTGGKLEMFVPQLMPQQIVEVIILFPLEQTSMSKRSAIDILNETSGHRLFRNAADVKQYLEEEGQSWGS